MVALYRLYYIRKLQSFLKARKFYGKRLIFRVLNFIKPPPRSGMIVKLENNIILQIDPIYDKGIERRLYNNGTYEAGTLWCLEKIIKPGDVIIDIGANIGLITIFASKLTGNNGKLYSFEPLPSTYEILLTNLKINKVENVFAYPIALSNYRGRGSIFPNLHINRGAASLNENSVIQNSETVEVSTFDYWMKKEEISQVDFIKIDVEGLEYEVIKGASSFFEEGSRPIICLEYSQEVNSNYEKSKLYLLFKDVFGYKLFKGEHGKEIPCNLVEIKSINDLPRHDNIYCFTENHLKNLPKGFIISNWK